jgi:hypothetical protein
MVGSYPILLNLRLDIAFLKSLQALIALTRWRFCALWGLLRCNRSGAGLCEWAPSEGQGSAQQPLSDRECA